MTKVIDFDAFRAEQKAEPIALQLGGHTYPLPTSLPATIALDVIRRGADTGDETEMAPGDLVKLGEAIFGGPDQFTKILTENDVTMEELPELFKMVFAVYNGEPDAPNPETPDPTSAAETASSR